MCRLAQTEPWLFHCMLRADTRHELKHLNSTEQLSRPSLHLARLTSPAPQRTNALNFIHVSDLGAGADSIVVNKRCRIDANPTEIINSITQFLLIIIIIMNYNLPDWRATVFAFCARNRDSPPSWSVVFATHSQPVTQHTESTFNSFFVNNKSQPYSVPPRHTLSIVSQSVLLQKMASLVFATSSLIAFDMMADTRMDKNARAKSILIDLNELARALKLWHLQLLLLFTVRNRSFANNKLRKYLFKIHSAAIFARSSTCRRADAFAFAYSVDWMHRRAILMAQKKETEFHFSIDELTCIDECERNFEMRLNLSRERYLHTINVKHYGSINQYLFEIERCEFLSRVNFAIANRKLLSALHPLRESIFRKKQWRK